MKRTRIDFAPPGLRRTLFRTPPRLIFMLPAVLLICVPAGFMTQRYVEQQQELTDLQAALAVGCQPVLVKTGKGERTLASPLPANTLVFEDLAAVAAQLLA